MAELSYGLDVEHTREYIVRFALNVLDLNSAAAEVLVLGTAMVESNLRYLDQIDAEAKPGPAYGLWQMEEATFRDIYDNYLRYRWDLKNKLQGLCTHSPRITDLHWNLAYAAAMCRVHYRRAKPALPAADDAHGLASYWKQHYNTPLGKGTVEKAIPYFKRAILIPTGAKS
jgi:hypothetical protein